MSSLYLLKRETCNKHSKRSNFHTIQRFLSHKSRPGQGRRVRSDSSFLRHCQEEIPQQINCLRQFVRSWTSQNRRRKAPTAVAAAMPGHRQRKPKGCVNKYCENLTTMVGFNFLTKYKRTHRRRRRHASTCMSTGMKKKQRKFFRSKCCKDKITAVCVREKCRMSCDMPNCQPPWRHDAAL